MAVEENKDNKRVEDKKTTTNKYPHEKVLFTQGGIRFIYGDEPGKEFIRMVHPSGSYSEVYPDGKTINFSVGDIKNYGKAGVTFSVDENNDLHIHGHNNIKVGGGAHIEVMGNAGIGVGGDVALTAIGNFNFDVQNCYMGVRGDFGMSVEGSANWKIVGDVEFSTGGKMDMKHGGSRSDTSPGHTINTPITTITDYIAHGGSMTSGGIHVDSNGVHI